MKRSHAGKFFEFLKKKKQLISVKSGYIVNHFNVCTCTCTCRMTKIPFYVTIRKISHRGVVTFTSITKQPLLYHQNCLDICWNIIQLVGFIQMHNSVNWKGYLFFFFFGPIIPSCHLFFLSPCPSQSTATCKQNNTHQINCIN